MVGRTILVDSGEIFVQEFGHDFNVTRIIANENRPFQDYVVDGLGNFRLAAAGNRARFVTQGAARPRAHQPPGRSAGLFFHPQSESIGKDIGGLGAQREAALRLIVLPPDGAFPNVEFRVFRHVQNIRILAVGREPVRHGDLPAAPGAAVRRGI